MRMVNYRNETKVVRKASGLNAMDSPNHFLVSLGSKGFSTQIFYCLLQGCSYIFHKTLRLAKCGTIAQHNQLNCHPLCFAVNLSFHIQMNTCLISQQSVVF